MKKTILCAATGAMLLSTSAFATKARMSALGQNPVTGSLYLDDTRNVFHNPAHLNNAKNYIVTEWGSEDADQNSSGNTEGEGGMFKEMGSFAYGIYLGSERNVQDHTDRAAAGYIMPENELDLFFAGDMGVQWGVRLNYASSKDETTDNQVAAGKGEIKQSSLGLGFGVVMGALDAYANLDLKDESEGTQTGATGDARDKWEADTGITVGASYEVNGMTPYVEYMKVGFEDKKQTDTTAETSETTNIMVGVARVHEVSSTAFVFCDVNYQAGKTETKAAGASATAESKDNDLNLTFGFESEANSWLTWRGSIKQEVLLNSTESKAATANTDVDGKKLTEEATTAVAAGLTLNFGKLQVDGSITTANTTAADLRFDSLIGQVGVHYWF